MFSTYLQNRNGRYHFRLRVPSDLQDIFPHTEIVKSLKTSDLRTARATALKYLQGISQTVTLLRARFISPEEAEESLHSLLGRKDRRQDAQGEGETGETVKFGTSLSMVVNAFLKDKERGWTPKTKMENSGVYRLIVDLLGDIPVETIDRGTVRNFREQLLKLPPNVYKRYPDISPSDVVSRAEEGTISDTPMSITSVNKHLSRLYSLMGFCIKEGYRTDNPASEMNVKEHRRPDEERKAYDNDDVKAIIANLPRDRSKPERFWVPVICMLSGMRLDEACQLYKEDIVKLDGVWCFDINDSRDKKLKSRSSKRIVPVHPTLLAQGFLRHVEQSLDGGRLWMNLTYCKVNGYRNSLGKWFQRFNRRYVTEDPLKTFHSLRHTFANALKQQGEQETVIAELMGHANGSITTGRYGKRYRPDVLLKAVTALNFNI